MIDLRSDTLTRPCPAMREAIASAEVNDDVIDRDPTVAALQEKVAELLGMEAAVFMPSGTMTNQVAVRLHCRPGDELICESGCHIYNYEQGGFAQLSGVVARPVAGNRGVVELEKIQDTIQPDNDHHVRTRLLCLENTHNKGGGVVLPYEPVANVCQWARKYGLATHLDGARLFNAVVASGISASQWAQHFDTVSICLSKGLGAPVGSILAGPASAVGQIKRHRKLFGGGMRQSGILAAGGLYAIENNIDRLADDHRHAKIIGDAVEQTDGLEIYSGQVDTNIVVFEIDANLGTAAEFCDQLKQAGVWMLPFSRQRARAVTHLHISETDAHHAATLLKEVAQAGSSSAKMTSI